MGGERGSSWSDLSGPQALEAHAPRSARALDALVGAVPGPPELVAVARRTCAAATGLAPLPDPAGGGGHHPQAGLVAELAGQLSVDVAGVGDELRGRFTAELGEAAFPLVVAMWVADMVPRVRHALDALFRPEPHGWPAVDESPAADPWPLLGRFSTVGWQLDQLDPVTTELVRLREARQHRCRFCMSLRSRVSLEAGATEDLVSLVDQPGHPDLEPHHHAALALLDELLWQPSRLQEPTLEAVRRHLSPAQAVELVLDVMRNGANKVMVALGADEARVEGGVDVYDIAPDGSLLLGLDHPGATA